jgi:hypothetical protein
MQTNQPGQSLVVRPAHPFAGTLGAAHIARTTTTTFQ